MKNQFSPNAGNSQPVTQTPLAPICINDVFFAARELKKCARRHYCRAAVRFLRWKDDLCERVAEPICNKMDYLTGADVRIEELQEERGDFAMQLKRASTENETLQAVLDDERRYRAELEKNILEFEADTEKILETQGRVVRIQHQAINDLVSDKLHLMAQVSHLRGLITEAGLEHLLEQPNNGGLNHGSHILNHPSQTIQPLPRLIQESQAEFQSPYGKLIISHTACPSISIDDQESERESEAA
ncbi:MAG TPA: hypothetical protein VGB77_09360 [Abditibacteriaceae bacterium]|jgi:hypothetical protein